MAAISRLISLALRSGVPSDAVVDQLQGITCHPVWDQGVLVRSVPDALSSVLKKYAEPTGAELPGLDDMYGTQLGMAMPNGGNGGNGNGKHSSGQICPECGGPVAFQEGCAVCQACAWNQCGG